MSSIASFVPWFLALAPSVQGQEHVHQGKEREGARTAISLPAAPQHGIQVAFLANEGFLLRSRDVGVLIDGFLRDPFNVYEAVPRTTLQSLVQATAPFNGPMVALVSHRHLDHFQPRPAEKFLRYNPKAMLVSSPQVVGALEKESDFNLIQAQVKTVQLAAGASETLRDQAGITVTFFDLAHSGEENKDIQNMGHLIEMGGVKVLHLGDADADGPGFDANDFASMEIDVAIVPYWYLGAESGRKVIREKLGKATIIASHIPPKDYAKFAALAHRDFPDVLFFRESLEFRVFEPRSADAPAGEPETGQASEPSDGR